jgi:nucleotide-binding universal stress UspA family protein
LPVPAGTVPAWRGEEEAAAIPAASSNHDRPSPFRRVLVGWDASPDSVTALKVAAAVARSAHGEVIALAVLPAPPPHEAWGDHEGEVSAGARHVYVAFESARASLAAISEAQVRLHTEEGRHVARSLCAYATEHAFDLLVLGRHGYEGILHPKLGHVAHAVARASRVPVLLVSAQATDD